MINRRNHARLWLLANLVAFLIHGINSQAIDPDLVVWTTVAGYSSWTTCLKQTLAGAGYNYKAIEYYVGCEVNSCLCRPNLLGKGIGILADRVLSRCSDFQEQSSATSILIAYCSAKGYTSILPPTILQTGACTQTPSATATVYATVYVTSYVKRSSSVISIQSPRLKMLTVVMLSMVFLFVGMF